MVVCVWLPFPHTWFVFQSSTNVSGAATSCENGRTTEGFKWEPTDPHKQALSFMASVTPSLLRPDSQTFKLYCSSPPPPPPPVFPPNQICTKHFNLSHTIQRSSLSYRLLTLTVCIYCFNSDTVHTVEDTWAQTHTHTYMYAHSVSPSNTHKHPRRQTEREEVNITLLSRMQKKFMLPLERKRGILCEPRWAIILLHIETRNNLFSGNMPPTNISPSSRKSTVTFALNGQTLICHLVGMCYFYCDYFYLHLFPWRQVITFCLDT